jgi:hypothetical protein
VHCHRRRKSLDLVTSTLPPLVFVVATHWERATTPFVVAVAAPWGWPVAPLAITIAKLKEGLRHQRGVQGAAAIPQI